LPINVNAAIVPPVDFQPVLLNFPAPSKKTHRSPKNGVSGGVLVPVQAVARAA
jgi:hypothetical protein